MDDLWSREKEIVSLVLELCARVRETVRPHLGSFSARELAGTAVGGDTTFGIDEVAERIYTEVNNGVYRCGFAALPTERVLADQRRDSRIIGGFALLTLVGLPFAFKYGKRGAVAGIGVALFLGLTYLFLTSLFVRFGESGSLPPLLAAWVPNVFFGLGAAWGLLGVRT